MEPTYVNPQTQWYEDQSNVYETMQQHSWGVWGLNQEEEEKEEEEEEEKEEMVVVVWYNCGVILLFQWSLF
jgi:hypothetical protein